MKEKGDGKYFQDLSGEIKRLVPELEYTPAVLITEEDYGEENLE